MSQTYRPPPPWLWDPARQLYFYNDDINNQLVYQDGQRFPRPLSGSNSLPRPYQVYGRHSRATLPQQPDALDQSFQRLELGNHTYSTSEALDPAHKQQGPGFFKIGRVFLTLWAEPSGASVSSSASLIGRFGESVYTLVRRFIIMRESTGYSLAIPITTYGGQGIRKRGVTASEHCIVYTGREPPREEEMDMSAAITLPAIRVVPDSPAEKLDPRSLINFGKIYTIEHNLKVKPFGFVQRSHMPILAQSFARVTGASLAGSRAPSEAATVVPSSQVGSSSSSAPRSAVASGSRPVHSSNRRQNSASSMSDTVVPLEVRRSWQSAFHRLVSTGHSAREAFRLLSDALASRSGVSTSVAYQRLDAMLRTDKTKDDELEDDAEEGDEDDDDDDRQIAE